MFIYIYTYINFMFSFNFCFTLILSSSLEDFKVCKKARLVTFLIAFSIWGLCRQECQWSVAVLYCRPFSPPIFNDFCFIPSPQVLQVSCLFRVRDSLVDASCLQHYSNYFSSPPSSLFNFSFVLKITQLFLSLTIIFFKMI